MADDDCCGVCVKEGKSARRRPYAARCARRRDIMAFYSSGSVGITEVRRVRWHTAHDW